MVNTTKKTTSKSAASTAAPAPATPAKTAAPKKAVAKKAAETKPAIEAKPESENVIVESKIDTIVDDSLTDQFSEFMGKLQSLSSLLSTLKNDFRSLEKKCLREFKFAKKLNERRARNRGTRAPSGFVKPTLVTDALADFLGKPHGVEMARTEVTREINKYIRANNLQDAQNGRKINPDSKLATLLNIKKDDELTYFNLQRYMSPHFPKPAAVAAAAPSSTA
jgi:chromatin remodeling complex protein RSC6|tara:strand:+ start:5687 stop:6352 length:666 start_codon:yes stop_codon:yes gene_type:complete